MGPSFFQQVLGTHRAPRPLVWVVGATFFHFTSLYYLFSTLPIYVLDLGGSTFDVGLIIGVFAVASLLARPLFGAWVDQVGRRRFLFLGAGIYVLASLGYLGTRTVTGLLVLRVFHALGLSTFTTAAASVAGDLAQPTRRGRTMGIYGLAQPSALSIGPAVGAAIQRALGYPDLFVAAACTAFLAGGCVLAIPETLPAVKASDIGKRKATGRKAFPRVAPSAGLQFSASIAYGTIVSFIAVVARDRGLDLVGTYFALLALSSLGVRLVAGRVYDAWGPRAVLAPAFVILATGMSLLAVTVRADMFLVAAILAGVGIGATHTALLARVVERSRADERGSAVAIFTSCWELGVGGGTIVMGRLAEAAGFSGMYAAAAAIPLVGLLGLSWLRKGRPESF